jgi:nitrate reductase (NAD(P)H)
MPPPWRVRVGNFTGATKKEIDEEPHWGVGHNHRVGFLNRQSRVAGFTHDGDHDEEEAEDRKSTDEAMPKCWKCGRLLTTESCSTFRTSRKGSLISMESGLRPFRPGWRFIVLAGEDWIKNEQE